jgi:hypothetical protein
VDLEAPRPSSAAEHTVQLTWTTRELYECHTDEDDKTPMDRHGEHRYTIALKYQNVSSSVKATQANTKGNANTNDNWTLVVCKDSLQVKFDGETGLTTVWLTGLCANCDYQCCLTLYDLCTNHAVTVRNTSVSHFKTTGVKGGESARPQNTSSSPQRPTRPTRPTTTSAQTTANSDSEEDESSTPTPPPRPHKINTATTATTATSNKPARPPRTTTPTTSTTTSTTASSNAQYFKSSKMLWMGFQELLNTEEKYVQDMTYLLVSVVRPLQQNTASFASSASSSASASSSTVPSIPSTAVHAIFCNLEQTVGVNR